MRVSYLTGKEPFLIIAPHGANCDDFNTDIVAERMARKLNGYAVINTGWERSKYPFVNKSLANLNNLEHCFKKECRKEFLDPILDFKEQICKNHGQCMIYLIHGMASTIQKKVKDNVHFVVGYGQGEPAYYSCGLPLKDRFIYLMRRYGFNIYQGSAGGRFSAWHKNNVNQLFTRRKKYADARVQSMQVEIVAGLRTSSPNQVGDALAESADQASWNLNIIPPGFRVDEY